MMKKILVFIFVIDIFVISLFSEDLKSGEIISREQNGTQQVIRTNCTYTAKIGKRISKEKQIVYETYSTSHQVGKLEVGAEVTVTEICTIIDTTRPESDNGYSYGEVWYKIENANLIGWIQVEGKLVSKSCNPYYHDNYRVIDVIESNGVYWTAHAINQPVSVWKVADVHEKPGIDSTVVTKIHDFEPGSRNLQENYTVVAITEEKDTVDGDTDYWLLIEYEPGKTGWIFGGITTVERGGPRFYIPELIIKSELNN